MRLDKDLTFLILLAANLLTIMIIGTQEPIAIESMLQGCLAHGFHMSFRFHGIFIETAQTAQFHIVRSDEHEEPGDEDGFGYSAFNVGRRLE
ncbi:hypothetical protein D3C77_614300 [compost metagenome]